MLQFSTLYRSALASLVEDGLIPTSFDSLAALETEADLALAALNGRKSDLARSGPVSRVLEALDAMIWTQSPSIWTARTFPWPKNSG